MQLMSDFSELTISRGFWGGVLFGWFILSPILLIALILSP